jgi:hypothetical protein
MHRVVTENPDLAVLVESGPEHLRWVGASVDDWFTELRTPGDEADGRRAHCVEQQRWAHFSPSTCCC